MSSDTTNSTVERREKDFFVGSKCKFDLLARDTRAFEWVALTMTDMDLRFGLVAMFMDVCFEQSPALLSLRTARNQSSTLQ